MVGTAVAVGLLVGVGVDVVMTVGVKVEVGVTVAIGNGEGTMVGTAVAVGLGVGVGATVALPAQARASAKRMRVNENVAIRMGLLRAARLGACHSCLPSTCIAQRRHKSQPLKYTSRFLEADKQLWPGKNTLFAVANQANKWVANFAVA